ncbi:MAG: hypothetical protein KGI65_04730 [Acidobacteriota bacterium]|nr:hypothetical protein [Acidobacteriota bacterium]
MRGLAVKTSFLVAAIVTASATPTGLSGASQSSSIGTVVSLKTPGALAFSPKGTLYVVDAGRDQILRRLPDGQFKAVAGDGRRGFSGDGRPAIDAEISVRHWGGLAVASNGTIYFTDEGNGRVREILPSGVIETVAGGGRMTLATTSVPALRANFGDQLDSVAIGPRGQLYIGGNGVYRLANGVLHWVVGSDAPGLNKGFKGFGTRPVVQKDFTPAQTLAVDGNGDLLVGGGGTWGLYERTTGGAFRFIQEDRAEGGYYAAMAVAPDGSVVLAGGAHGLARFHPSGVISAIPASGLSTLLAPPSHFTVGEGVAVAPNGSIYLDADAGNGFSSVSAIVRVTPAGHAVLVWKS